MAGDYDEAERRIAEAKASGARELSLRGLDIDRLPDSLRTLTRLETLDLRGCQKLADIRAVSCLTGALLHKAANGRHDPLPSRTHATVTTCTIHFGIASFP